MFVFFENLFKRGVPDGFLLRGVCSFVAGRRAEDVCFSWLGRLWFSGADGRCVISLVLIGLRALSRCRTAACGFVFYFRVELFLSLQIYKIVKNYSINVDSVSATHLSFVLIHRFGVGSLERWSSREMSLKKSWSSTLQMRWSNSVSMSWLLKIL